MSRTCCLRRRSRAVLPPWVSALELPMGAPRALPPCIRHRPFRIAGARHGQPLRVRAPQRGAPFSAKTLPIISSTYSRCMGLIVENHENAVLSGRSSHRAQLQPDDPAQGTCAGKDRRGKLSYTAAGVLKCKRGFRALPFSVAPRASARPIGRRRACAKPISRSARIPPFGRTTPHASLGGKMTRARHRLCAFSFLLAAWRETLSR